MALANYSQDFMNAMNDLSSSDGYSFDDNGTLKNSDLFSWNDTNPWGAGQRALDEKTQMQDEAKNPEDMTYEEQKALAEEQQKAGQKKELYGSDKFFASLSQLAKNVSGLWGFEDNFGKFQNELDKGNIDVGSALKAGVGFVGQMGTMGLTIPLDTASQIYEAATGTPVTESHEGDDGRMYGANYELSDVQRNAALGEGLANTALMTVGGIGAGIRGVGKMANALARGEQAAEKGIFRAGKNAIAEAAESNLGKAGRFAGNVGISGIEGAGLGALGAIRGDQNEFGFETKDGESRADKIAEGALSSAAMMAAGGALGHAKAIFGEKVSSDIVNEEKRLGLNPGEYDTSQQSKLKRDTIPDHLTPEQQKDIAEHSEQNPTLTSDFIEKNKEIKKDMHSLNIEREMLVGDDDNASSMKVISKASALQKFNADIKHLKAIQKWIDDPDSTMTASGYNFTQKELDDRSEYIARAWGFNNAKEMFDWDINHNTNINGSSSDAENKLMAQYNNARTRAYDPIPPRMEKTWKEPGSGKQGFTGVDRIVDNERVEGEVPPSVAVEAQSDYDSDFSSFSTIDPIINEKLGNIFYHNLDLLDSHTKASHESPSDTLLNLNMHQSQIGREAFANLLSNIDARINQLYQAGILKFGSVKDYMPDLVDKNIKDFKEFAYSIYDNNKSYDRNMADFVYALYKEKADQYSKTTDNLTAKVQADNDLFGQNGLFREFKDFGKVISDASLQNIKDKMMDDLDNLGNKIEVEPKPNVDNMTYEERVVQGGINTENGKTIANQYIGTGQNLDRNQPLNGVRQTTEEKHKASNILKGYHEDWHNLVTDKFADAMKAIFDITNTGEHELKIFKNKRDASLIYNYLRAADTELPTGASRFIRETKEGDLIIDLSHGISQQEIDIIVRLAKESDRMMSKSLESLSKDRPKNAEFMMFYRNKDASDIDVFKSIMGDFIRNEDLGLKIETIDGPKRIYDIAAEYHTGSLSRRQEIENSILSKEEIAHNSKYENSLAEILHDEIFGNSSIATNEKQSIITRTNRRMSETINDSIDRMFAWIYNNFSSVEGVDWTFNNFGKHTRDLWKILEGLQVLSDKMASKRGIIGLNSAFADKIFGNIFKNIQLGKKSSPKELASRYKKALLIQSNNEAFGPVIELIESAQTNLNAGNERQGVNDLVEALNYAQYIFTVSDTCSNKLYKETASVIIAHLDGYVLEKQNDRYVTHNNWDRNLNTLINHLNRFCSEDMIDRSDETIGKIISDMLMPKNLEMDPNAATKMERSKSYNELEKDYMIDFCNGFNKKSNELGIKQKNKEIQIFLGDNKFETQLYDGIKERSTGFLKALSGDHTISPAKAVSLFIEQCKYKTINMSPKQILESLFTAHYADAHAKDKGTTPTRDTIVMEFLRNVYNENGIQVLNPLNIYSLGKFNEWTPETIAQNPNVILRAFWDKNFEINIKKQTANGQYVTVHYNQRRFLEMLGLRFDSKGELTTQSFIEFFDVEKNPDNIKFLNLAADEYFSSPSMEKETKPKWKVPKADYLDQFNENSQRRANTDSEEYLKINIRNRLMNRDIYARLSSYILDAEDIARNEHLTEEQWNSFQRKMTEAMDWIEEGLIYKISGDEQAYKNWETRSREAQQKNLLDLIQNIEIEDYSPLAKTAETKQSIARTEVIDVLFQDESVKEINFKDTIDKVKQDASPNEIIAAFAKDFVTAISKKIAPYNQLDPKQLNKAGLEKLKTAADQIIRENITSLKMWSSFRKWSKSSKVLDANTKDFTNVTLADFLGVPKLLKDRIIEIDPDMERYFTSIEDMFDNTRDNTIADVDARLILPDEPAFRKNILNSYTTRSQKSFDKFLSEITDLYRELFNNNSFNFKRDIKMDSYGVLDKNNYETLLNLWINREDIAIGELLNEKVIDVYYRDVAEKNFRNDITVSSIKELNNIFDTLADVATEIRDSGQVDINAAKKFNLKNKTPNEIPDLTGVVFDGLNQQARQNSETAGGGLTNPQTAAFGYMCDRLYPIQVVAENMKPLTRDVHDFSQAKGNEERKAAASNFLRGFVNRLYSSQTVDGVKTFQETHRTKWLTTRAINQFLDGNYSMLAEKLGSSKSAHIKASKEILDYFSNANRSLDVKQDDWFCPNVNDLITLMEGIQNGDISTVEFGTKLNTKVGLIAKLTDLCKESLALTVRKQTPEPGTKNLDLLCHNTLPISRENNLPQDPIALIEAIQNFRNNNLIEFHKACILESRTRKLDRKEFYGLSISDLINDEELAKLDPGELDIMFPYIDVEYENGSVWRHMVSDFYDGSFNPTNDEPTSRIKAVHMDIIDPIRFCDDATKKSISSADPVQTTLEQYELSKPIKISSTGVAYENVAGLDNLIKDLPMRESGLPAERSTTRINDSYETMLANQARYIIGDQKTNEKITAIKQEQTKIKEKKGYSAETLIMEDRKQGLIDLQIKQKKIADEINSVYYSRSKFKTNSEYQRLQIDYFDNILTFGNKRNLEPLQKKNSALNKFNGIMDKPLKIASKSSIIDKLISSKRKIYKEKATVIDTTSPSDISTNQIEEVLALSLTEKKPLIFTNKETFNSIRNQYANTEISDYFLDSRKSDVCIFDPRIRNYKHDTSRAPIVKMSAQRGFKARYRRGAVLDKPGLGFMEDLNDASILRPLIEQEEVPARIGVKLTLPKEIDVKSIVGEPKIISDLGLIDPTNEKISIVMPEEFAGDTALNENVLTNIKKGTRIDNALAPDAKDIVGVYRIKMKGGFTYYVPIIWDAPRLNKFKNINEYNFDVNNFKLKGQEIIYPEKEHYIPAGNNKVQTNHTKAGTRFVNFNIKAGKRLLNFVMNRISDGDKIRETRREYEYLGSIVLECLTQSDKKFSLLDIIDRYYQSKNQQDKKINGRSIHQIISNLKDFDSALDFNNQAKDLLNYILRDTKASKAEIIDIWEYYLKSELKINDSKFIEKSKTNMYNAMLNIISKENLNPFGFFESDFWQGDLPGFYLDNKDFPSAVGVIFKTYDDVCSIFGPLTGDSIVDHYEATDQWDQMKNVSSARIKEGYFAVKNVDAVGNDITGIEERRGFMRPLWSALDYVQEDTAMYSPAPDGSISDTHIMSCMSYSGNASEGYKAFLKRTNVLKHYSDQDVLDFITKLNQDAKRKDTPKTPFNQAEADAINADLEKKFYDPQVGERCANQDKAQRDMKIEIFEGSKEDSDPSENILFDWTNQNNFITMQLNRILEAWKNTDGYIPEYTLKDYQHAWEFMCAHLNITPENGTTEYKIHQDILVNWVDDTVAKIEKGETTVTQKNLDDGSWRYVDPLSHQIRIRQILTNPDWYIFHEQRKGTKNMDLARQQASEAADFIDTYSNHIWHDNNILSDKADYIKTIENSILYSQYKAGISSANMLIFAKNTRDRFKIVTENTRSIYSEMSEDTKRTAQEIVKEGTEAIVDTTKASLNKHQKQLDDNNKKTGATTFKEENIQKQQLNSLNDMADIMQGMGLLDIKITAQNVIAKEIGYFSQSLWQKLAELGTGPFSSGRSTLQLSFDPAANRDMIKEISRTLEFSKIVDLLEAVSHSDRANDDLWNRLAEGTLTMEQLNRAFGESTRLVDKFRNFACRIGCGEDIGKTRRNEVFLRNWLKIASENDRIYSLLNETTSVKVGNEIVDMTALQGLLYGNKPNESAARLIQLMLNSMGNRELAQVTRKAYNITMYGDMAHESVPSKFLEAFIQKNGLTRTLSCILGTRYIRASNNVLGRSLNSFLPMSTFNYELAQWVKNHAYDEKVREKLGNIECLKKWSDNPELLKDDMEAVKGYNRLREALFFDACHMSLGMLLMVLVCNSDFLQPPDDKNKQHNYKEWTIGGLRVNHNWWLDDLFGVALPMACWIKSGQMGQPNFNILTYGLQEHCANNPFIKLGDLVDVLTETTDHSDEVSDTISRYENNPQGAPEGLEYMLATAPAMGMSMFGNLLTPTFIKDWSKTINQNEKSYNTIYKTNAKGGKDEEAAAKGQTEKVTFQEAQIRKVTRNNPILGAFMNLVTGGGRGTGYLSWEMPDQVYSDPTEIAFMKKYSVIDENGKYKSKAERDQVIGELIIMLSLTDDMKELYDNGWCLDNETKNMVAQEITNCYYETKQDFENLRLGGYLDPTTLGDGDYKKGLQEYNKIMGEYRQQLSYWQSMYRDKLYSKDLNRTITRYTRYNTTYEKDAEGNWYATGMKEGLGGFIAPLLTAPTNPEKVDPNSDWASRSQLDNGALYDNNGNAMRGMVAMPTSQLTIPSMSSWVNEKLNESPISASSSKRSGRSGGSGGGKSIHSNLPNFDIGKAASSYGSVNRDRTYYDDYRPNVEVANTRNARSYNKI